MRFERQIVFWIAALFVVVALLWLLHDILLPFLALQGCRASLLYTGNRPA